MSGSDLVPVQMPMPIIDHYDEHETIIKFYIDNLLTVKTTRNCIVMFQRFDPHIKGNNIKTMEIDDALILPDIKCIDISVKSDPDNEYDFYSLLYSFGDYMQLSEKGGDDQENLKVMFLRNNNNKLDELYIKFNDHKKVMHKIYYCDIHKNLPLIKETLFQSVKKVTINEKDQIIPCLIGELNNLFAIRCDDSTDSTDADDNHLYYDIDITDCIYAQFETFEGVITDKDDKIIEIIEKDKIFDPEFNIYYNIYINPLDKPEYNVKFTFPSIIL